MASTELRAAAQQALEAWDSTVLPKSHDGMMQERMESLRSALAEPVQEPQGCAHCNHFMYAATRCRVCGRVTEPTTEDSSAVEPVQEPFALPCPTPKACKAHCCSGQCIPRAELAEPVHDHFRDARKMVQEPAQKTEMRRCPRCWEPMFPPQPTPLTVERLRDALVASRIVPPAAVEDPDGYDDGVTLHRIEALHRRLA